MRACVRVVTFVGAAPAEAGLGRPPVEGAADAARVRSGVAIAPRLAALPSGALLPGVARLSGEGYGGTYGEG